MLELLDVTRERGLRDIERACCSAEAAAFGHGHEIAKLAQIHGLASRISKRDRNHIKHILARYRKERSLPQSKEWRNAWAPQMQRVGHRSSSWAAARLGSPWACCST